MGRGLTKTFPLGKRPSLTISVQSLVDVKYPCLSPRSLMDRALDCGSKGCAFESRRGRTKGGVSEWFKETVSKTVGPKGPRRFESYRLRRK